MKNLHVRTLSTMKLFEKTSVKLIEIKYSPLQWLKNLIQ